ncbi:MAG: NAD-dependent epimerase/dehydratase family protein [Abitibacteriaceae bacterium]|nr:NAD-dependent epimerase/dehydratase family protein [Abditibacteriaceae bacterium]
MHVLFIGGTGLISTAIARQLLDAGHQVTLFNRGKSENRLPAGAQAMHGDRKDYATFEKTFEDKTFDVAVDMVAFHPDDTASAIRAFKGRVGQFIHCSTVCVYSGPVTQIPTTETETYHSLGGYGKNKIACEQMLLQEWETNRFPVTIMRPSHSYGEGGSIIRSFGPADTFIDRLRKGKPIIVQGDGNSLWAACHVDDVARGFIGVMNPQKCLGQAYNITGDEWMTWNMYHEQVAEVVGGTFEPVYIPTETLRQVAPKMAGGTYEIFEWPSIFDNSKIKRDTDYQGQTVSWKEGVRRTVAWMESKDKLANSDEDDYEDRLIAAWRSTTGELPHQA